MKLHLASPSARNIVTAYGSDHVVVSGRILRRSLLLLPEDIDAEWGPDSFASLADIHFAALVPLPCDVLLLGTGMRQRFPARALLRPLLEAGRSIEIMDTPAACRTFNILVLEGRQVAAALILECS